MTRTPLDLRGLSLTELIDLERTIGYQLSALDLSTIEIGFTQHKSDQADNLLADRRQIREEMERRREAYEAICRRAEEIPDYEIEAAKNVYP